MNDAAIWLLVAAVLGTAAVLLETAFKAINRRRGLPVAMAMHPTAGEHRIRPAAPHIDDAGRWVR